MRLELHATPAEVMRAVEAWQEFGQARKLPQQTVFGLALALEECASNVVHHALRGDAGQRFWVTLEQSEAAVRIEIRDGGPAFDPTQAPVVPLKARDDQPAGGWGIQIARRYTDEIHYAREDEENVLRLMKRLA